MIPTVVVVGAILVVALVVARLMDRRRRARVRPVDARVSAGRAPAQIDRWDFDRPGAPWLVLLFSSNTCDGCGFVATEVQLLESPDVAVAVAEWSAQPDLHEKYAIDGVPVVVLADRQGITRAEFVGIEAMDDMPERIRALVAAG